MRRNLWILMASCVAWAGVAGAATAPKTEEDKALYALGVILSRNIQPFEFTARELELVQAGLADAVLGKESIEDPDSYVPQLQALQQKRAAAAAGTEKAAGAAFLARAAAEKGATKTASGIVMSTLSPGTGASPTARDQVKVHYEGTLVNGTVFDSSIARNEPATFPLSNVIPCWTEAVQLMKVGGRSRIVCPSDLAYGDSGRPPQIPGGSTLVFQVDLLDVVKAGVPAAGN
jgi:FKBP-type peptidyl-prolyl cis-trans isomerase FkpA/FKBP-type peptidyl-prolyl cis-trans isomerase FklB